MEEEIPLAKLWALNTWVIENDPWGAADRVTNGYVAQEMKQLLAGKLIGEE